jgi:Protein of unknown function (DUF2961)
LIGLIWQVMLIDRIGFINQMHGRGQYVGTYLAWGVRNNGWWGEGEVMAHHLWNPQRRLGLKFSLTPGLWSLRGIPGWRSTWREKPPESGTMAKRYWRLSFLL